ncbi:MAG: glycosyltransferase family 4 protein [Candidatus Eremiobacteraeota bacterium]|nr:glycosyltransferase family 4 protein [Candidatus Eremiobacteraeota bacterium]
MIAFWLPEDEIYSPEKGSSLSRWVFEVVQAWETCDSEGVQVWANQATASQVRYSGPLQQNPWLPWFQAFSRTRLGRILEGRFPGLTYCLAWWPFWRTARVLVLENRPHYSLYLRFLGFRGQIVLHQHNRRFSGVEDRYLQRLERTLNGIIGCSWAILMPLKTRNPQLFSRCRVVYNAANPALFHPGRGQKRPDVILFVGQVVDGKGLHLLFDAVQQMGPDFAEVKVWVAARTGLTGHGRLSDYEKQLESQINHLGLANRVRWLGFIQHEQELPKLMAEATVLCLPSVAIEAFPLVILEAMHAGTPVVATDVGGVREGLEDVGLVVEPEVEPLASALTRVFNDAELRERMTRSGLEKARRVYRWPLVAENFARALNSLTGAPENSADRKTP